MSLLPARPERRIPRRTAALALLASVALSLAACGGDDAAGGAPGAGARAGGAGGGGAQGAGGARGAGGGPGGGRGGIVLSPSDVTPVKRGAIEAATPITGDLRPIETVVVRARIEGDLVSLDVREGDRVARGQVLARFEAADEDADRRAAEADREAARSDLATAQWNLEQNDELFKAGAIAEGQLRVTRQQVATARSRLAAAEARVRAASTTLADTRVLAPTTGIVEKRFVMSGERVPRGAQLFTVVRTDVLELAAAVPARLAEGLRPGQKARFIADGRTLEGSVARVSPTVDPASRSVTVYIQIPNPAGTLRGNTFATGRVVGRTIDDAMLVPTSAVRTPPDSGKPYVYRVVGDQIDYAELDLGVVDEEAGIAQVVDGLAPTDRVVVGNVGTLGRGMKVTFVGEGGRGAAGGAGGRAGQAGGRAGGQAGNAPPRPTARTQ